MLVSASTPQGPEKEHHGERFNPSFINKVDLLISWFLKGYPVLFPLPVIWAGEGVFKFQYTALWIKCSACHPRPLAGDLEVFQTCQGDQNFFFFVSALLLAMHA